MKRSNGSNFSSHSFINWTFTSELGTSMSGVPSATYIAFSFYLAVITIIGVFANIGVLCTILPNNKVSTITLKIFYRPWYFTCCSGGRGSGSKLLWHFRSYRSLLHHKKISVLLIYTYKYKYLYNSKSSNNDRSK